METGILVHKMPSVARHRVLLRNAACMVDCDVSTFRRNILFDIDELREVHVD